MSSVKLTVSKKQAFVIMCALKHWSAATSDRAKWAAKEDKAAAASWFKDAEIANKAFAHVNDRLSKTP